MTVVPGCISPPASGDRLRFLADSIDDSALFGAAAAAVRDVGRAAHDAAHEIAELVGG